MTLDGKGLCTCKLDMCLYAHVFICSCVHVGGGQIDPQRVAYMSGVSLDTLQIQMQPSKANSIC